MLAYSQGVYTWIKLFHILASIVWIGGGVFVQIYVTRLKRANEMDRLRAFARDIERMGISSNVAVGYVSVWRPRILSRPSRRSSSLRRAVVPTSTESEVIDASSITSVPVTFRVRPTAVLAPTPPSSSWIRWPANVDDPSSREPEVVSTVHVPSADPVPPVVDVSVGVGLLDVEVSLASAGASPPKHPGGERQPRPDEHHGDRPRRVPNHSLRMHPCRLLVPRVDWSSRQSGVRASEEPAAPPGSS